MERAVTLNELLESRDRRRDLQQRLLAQHPDQTLMVLTIVAPGPVKRTPRSLKAARAALKAIASEFANEIAWSEERDLDTGFEGWFLLQTPEAEAKRRACAIEDTHPLGRLFDVDIIGKDLVPLGRSALGLSPRKCLICNEEARLCMRQRSHTPEQIAQKIAQLTDNYFD